MQSTKSVDLIGHIEFLLWGQFDGCSVTRPFLSHAKGVACETTLRVGKREAVCKSQVLDCKSSAFLSGVMPERW